jgi:hypothetical protein
MISRLSLAIGLFLFVFTTGCAPSTFVKASPGWKTLEIRDNLTYDQCWMTTVDLLTRDWDVEMLDKSSGYIRTAWHQGISGGPQARYRGRITVKFPDPKACTTVEIKTEAEWFGTEYPWGNPYWIPGYDSSMQRDVYTAMGGRLTRNVPKE